MPSLHTPRLTLEPLTLADAPAIQRAFPHWEIVRMMAGTIPWPYPRDGAYAYLSNVALPDVTAGKSWHWSLRPQTAPDTLIGVVSLMTAEDDNRGFWMARDWQGQGLMTEASDAATDFWFDILGQPVLRVPKASDNIASRRISERTGARILRSEERQMVAGPMMCDIWEINRTEWHAYRKAQSRH
jgi:RimJ/RimL family protein N-acetyltransferase